MELKPESREKIYSALRSLFRYNQMKAKEAPSVLIDMEWALLDGRLGALSTRELHLLILAWPEYLEEERVSSEIEDEACARDLEQMYRSLN